MQQSAEVSLCPAACRVVDNAYLIRPTEKLRVLLSSLLFIFLFLLYLGTVQWTTINWVTKIQSDCLLPPHLSSN